MAQMKAMLQNRAEELGLPYQPAPILANSALALAGAEFARDEGRFEDFHREMLEAVFSRGQNIGLREVIADIAVRAGLDGSAMLQAIDEKRYDQRLRQSQELGQQLQVSGVPTFIVNDRYAIVGAQPEQTFRDIFRRVEEEAGAGDSGT